MKTVLFVHHVSLVGGGSFCLLNILKEIDRNSINPVVLLKNDGPLVKKIKELGIDVFFMPSMCTIPYNKSLFNIKSLITYFNVYKSLSDFKCFLRKHTDVDLVYLNNMMLFPYLKIAKKEGLKTILHCREHWPLNDHVMQLRYAQQSVHDYADQLIAINEYSASIFDSSSYKTTIVYDWIDMQSRYTKVDLEKVFHDDVSKLKIILFTGGFLYNKGALEVVRAFKEVFSTPEFRLLVFGSVKPPISNYSGIKKQIKKFLDFLGIKNYQEKVYDLIKSDDRIVCLESRYDIAFFMEQAYCMINFFNIPHANLALAEGIIMNTVCVVSKTEESIEYSENGKLACLCDFGDYVSFCQALLNLPSIYEKLKASLNEESNNIRMKFSRINNVEKLNKVLSEI